MLEARMTQLASTPRIDQDEFLCMVRPVLGQGQALAQGMLGNRPDAEDAVQEAALKAWSRISSFKHGSDFRSWFLTIVANECRQALRRPWWRVLRRPFVDLGVTQAQQDPVAASGALKEALSRLSADHRAVIVLRYYLDQSFEEMGKVLGIPTTTARTRTHRALARLRPLITVAEELEDE